MKAMVVKSAPMDDMNIIVFAVRGTQTFMDWITNLNTKPMSPEGFLVRPFQNHYYEFANSCPGRP